METVTNAFGNSVLISWGNKSGGVKIFKNSGGFG